MVFVDGSNFLAELGTKMGIKVRADRPTRELLLLASEVLGQTLAQRLLFDDHRPQKIFRKYWFGSIQGSESELNARQEWLRELGYDAILFPKVKGRGEKGVDLAVAREMLIHAFNHNYDVAVLVAGDEDYLGLIQDIKRIGRLTTGIFFDSAALSKSLRLAFDNFYPLGNPIEIRSDFSETVRLQYTN